MLVVAICTRHSGIAGDPPNLVVCYPDTNLHAAEELMLPRGLHQLPVVTRIGSQWQDRGHKVVGVLHRESIPICTRYNSCPHITHSFATHRKLMDAPLHKITSVCFYLLLVAIHYCSEILIMVIFCWSFGKPEEVFFMQLLFRPEN